MTKLSVLSIMVLAIGCGIQEPDDASAPQDDKTIDVNIDVNVDDQTPDVPSDPVEPQYVAGPFRSPASCIWDFNSAYVSGATCGEVRGNLPNMTWTDGPAIANPDGDGWMGMSYTVGNGTYEFSYLGFQNCGSSTPNEAWAQYSYEDQLSAMTSADRAFINCNWWDAAHQQKLNVSTPSCNLKVTVTNCVISAAGNMANFNL